MKRTVALVFADGHEEQVTLNLADPFARMDIVPLTDEHGDLVRRPRIVRTDDEGVEDRNLGRARNRLERSVA